MGPLLELPPPLAQNAAVGREPALLFGEAECEH